MFMEATIQPKVSVIIPVYKAEKYIRRCINSLEKQSLDDFEVLLVDDGSPDRCGIICDEYAANDSRIRVFHQENFGVSASRQVGLDHARGEYVIHTDPDDWIEPQMLLKLYEKAKEHDSDVVICDYYVNTALREYVIKQEPSDLNHMTVLSELFQQLHGSCCNKLVKRACYMKYKVSFPTDVSYCEDLSFWVCLLKHPVSIAYLPEAFYHYVQHDTSIVHSYMNRKEDDGWKLICLIRRELRDYSDIKRNACARTAYSVVRDAYRYGNFNSFTFSKRYLKYVPYLLNYRRVNMAERLFYLRVCIGFYSYYKYRQKK